MSPREEAPTIDVSDAFHASNLGAERAILGTMLSSSDAIFEARGLLQARHFFRAAHSLIFEALLALHLRQEEPSLITLKAELQSRGRFDQAGGDFALAALYEAAGAQSNLKHYAKLVRERSVRRAAVEAGQKLAEVAKDPTRVIDEEIQSHRKAMRALTEEHGAIQRQAWMEQILTLQQTLDTEFPKIESIIGDGILTHGSYGLFAGHSGLGKTYLSIQMLSSILRGESFLGQPTNPCRVGMLEFEMPWQAMKARALRFAAHEQLQVQRGDLPSRAEGRPLGFEGMGNGADLLCMPKGRWYFNERDVIERIVDWCGERFLKLLVVDPLNRIRSGDANDEEVAGELLDAIHEITERTGTTILVVHHVRKTPAIGHAATKTSTSSLDSIKGPSRYVDDADTVFVLDEILDGNERLIRFEWAKSRFGAKPPYVYLRRNSTGFFDVVESPSEVRETNDDRVATLLRLAGTDGLRLEAVMAEFQVNIDKARRMVTRVGGVGRGKTSGRRYYEPSVLDQLEPELPGVDE